MSAFIKKLQSDESGATAIEYGLIAALISVVIIVTLQAVGTNLDQVFAAIRDNLTVAN
jgi:pilus assembly protein Flp/PilA